MYFLEKFIFKYFNTLKFIGNINKVILKNILFKNYVKVNSFEMQTNSLIQSLKRICFNDTFINSCIKF